MDQHTAVKVKMLLDRVIDNYEGRIDDKTNVERNPTMLIVTDIAITVSEEDLRILFSEFGDLKTLSLHCDTAGRSLNTAHVVFEYRSDAIQAMDVYDGLPLDGKLLNIMMCTKHPSSEDSDKVPRLKITDRLGVSQHLNIADRLGFHTTNFTDCLNAISKKRVTDRLGVGKCADRKSIADRLGAPSCSTTLPPGTSGHVSIKDRVGLPNNGRGNIKRRHIYKSTVEELDAELDAYVDANKNNIKRKKLF